MTFIEKNTEATKYIAQVFDSESKKTVPFTVVQIIKKDSKIENQTVDAKGEFILNSKQDIQKITLSNVGYRTLNIDFSKL